MEQFGGKTGMCVEDRKRVHNDFGCFCLEREREREKWGGGGGGRKRDRERDAIR